MCRVLKTLLHFFDKSCISYTTSNHFLLSVSWYLITSQGWFSSIASFKGTFLARNLSSVLMESHQFFLPSTLQDFLSFIIYCLFRPSELGVKVEVYPFAVQEITRGSDLPDVDTLVEKSTRLPFKHFFGTMWSVDFFIVSRFPLELPVNL